VLAVHLFLGRPTLCSCPSILGHHLSSCFQTGQLVCQAKLFNEVVHLTRCMFVSRVIFYFLLSAAFSIQVVGGETWPCFLNAIISFLEWIYVIFGSTSSTLKYSKHMGVRGQDSSSSCTDHLDGWLLQQQEM
jgi:hypothetical protein